MIANTTIRPRGYVSAKALAYILRFPLRFPRSTQQQAIRLAVGVRWSRFDS